MEDLHIPHDPSVSEWVTISIGGVTIIPEKGKDYNFYLNKSSKICAVFINLIEIFVKNTNRIGCLVVEHRLNCGGVLCSNENQIAAKDRNIRHL